MDITKARLQHIHWTEQVIGAIKKGKLPEVSNHKECDLGKWLQTINNKQPTSIILTITKKSPDIFL